MSQQKWPTSPESPFLAPDVLVRRLAVDDEAALDELLRRFWSPLVAYVKEILGDTDEARDVSQEAFVRLWNQRRNWSAGGSVRAFLFRVGRNLALNRLRHDRLRTRVQHQLDREERHRSTPATPVQLFERAELRLVLEEAIAALPPRRGEVFRLGYIHDLSHSEIAEVLEISTHTVKNQMSSALSQLRSSLEPFL